LAGAAGGYALSKALEGDDEKKDESTTAASTTTAAGGSTTPPAATTTAAGSSTPAIFVTTIASNETTTLNANETTTLSSNETTTADNSTSIDTTALPTVTEALIEAKNSSAVNQALSSDGIVAKLSMNIALLSLIYQIIF
jgi:hypothetical protein